MSSWCVLVAVSVGSVIRRRTVVRTAMMVRTAMVVRTANQRATIRAAIRATVKRGDVRPVEEEATVRKYKRYGANRVRGCQQWRWHICANRVRQGPSNGGGKT
jgi:hypothetical protein